MDQVMSDLDLVGLRLFGPGPHGGAYLRLAEGVTVLYGKNGAGKTSALTSIRAALTGIHNGSKGWLCVRVTRPAAPLSEADDPLLRAIAQALTPKGTFTRDTDSILDLVQDFVQAERRSPLDLELVRDIASQGCFVLSPVGTKGPQWHLWLAGLDDEAMPYLREQIVSLRGLWERARRTEEDIGDLEPLVIDHPLGAGFEDPNFLFDDHAFGPSWAPLVLDVIDPKITLEEPIAFVFDDESLTDVDAATTQLLRADPQQSRLVLQPGSDQITSEIETMRSELSRVATDIYAELLLDAPSLNCVIHPPEAWFDGRALQWVAYDLPTGEWVPLPALSHAQRRWAEVAIAAALVQHQPPHARSIMLIDEPELALHSLAEQHMARALPTLASKMNTQLIVASHSADLLNQSTNRLVHVRRGASGITEMATLEAGVGALPVDDLGIKPSDLLQLRRVFLLVEGEHDRIILDGLLGDKFAELGVDLLPFRGGVQLAHVIDSQFLFLFTDARVIIVLDNLRAESISQLWSEVKARLATGDAIGARRLLETDLGREGEKGFLREFGIRAVEESRTDRIEVFGLSKRDIICYLPIQAFVPSASSWQEVEARYDKEHPPGSHQQPGYRNFKRWLKATYGAKTTVPVIRGAIDSLDAVPNEFIDLLRLCQYPMIHAPNSRHVSGSDSN
jgi:energy-coupling factor transporter ATP-binding protein EcfA2